MKSVLEQLYDGGIVPGEKRFVGDSDYGRAIKALAEGEEKLLGLLDEQGKALFLTLSNANGEINAITAVEYFADGFRLGARIIMAVLSDGAGCLRDVHS